MGLALSLKRFSARNASARNALATRSTTAASFNQRPSVEPLEGRSLFSVVTGFAQSTLASGLTQPTTMAFAPDGRLFVTEQGGTLRIIDGQTLLPTPALTLNVPTDGERGLLGLTFDPAFQTNGFLYLYYTATTPTLHNRVSRFTIAGDTVDPSSEVVLLDLPDLSTATNHNGGALHFAPDGTLFVAVGENANADNSQSLSTTLGKLLRINADGTIPADNPLVTSTTGQNQAIWASGLRNPYTFAFRSDGKLFINDVGQSSFEEVNVGTAGANYGWPIIEGKRTTQTAPADYADPLVAYGRDGEVSGAAIAGGTFYETAAEVARPFPSSYQGNYFVADWGSGWVKSVNAANGQVTAFADGLSGPLDVDVGPDGNLYALEYFSGQVTKFAVADADLAISYKLDARKTDAVQNDKDRIAVTIDNVGGTAVKGPVTVRLLASTDELPDDADTVVTERVKNLNLKAGKSSNLTLNFRYPSSLNGAYLLLAQVVPDASLGDTNTANNTVPANVPVLVEPPQNDLEASLPDGSRTISAGDKNVKIRVQLVNLGNSTFNGSVTATLTAIDRATQAEVPLGQVGKKLAIAVGKGKAVQVKFNAPSALVAGAYDLRAVVQPAGKLPDPIEDNNTTLGELLVG